jgi:hypothetical protein
MFISWIVLKTWHGATNWVVKNFAGFWNCWQKCRRRIIGRLQHSILLVCISIEMQPSLRDICAPFSSAIWSQSVLFTYFYYLIFYLHFQKFIFWHILWTCLNFKLRHFLHHSKSNYSYYDFWKRKKVWILKS